MWIGLSTFGIPNVRAKSYVRKHEVVFFVIKLICGWSLCPSTLHLSLRVTGADHVPHYGKPPLDSFAKSTLSLLNASQTDILVAIGRSSDSSLARSDFNIQWIHGSHMRTLSFKCGSHMRTA